MRHNASDWSMYQGRAHRHIEQPQYPAYVPCGRPCKLLRVDAVASLRCYAARTSSAGGLNTVYSM